MPDDPLHQPHDKLFRATFSDPRNAAAFLRHHLGGDTASCIDWASLSLLPGSFINDQMKGFEADLLFSVRIGPSDALVYIRWEHQHSEAPLMAFKLLKATFLVAENARAFFATHLPAELATAIDWTSLALEPCSFIEPQFANSESDLLFRIKLHQSDAFVYLLFEHQSTEDPRMALRLLSYILRIWERFAKDKPPPARLPAVLPIVLAQGRRPWKTVPSLEALIELPAECAEVPRPWQPALAYHFLELARMPYTALAGTPEGILTLRALKAEPMGELLGDALWDESLLFSISGDALERLLHHILNAYQEIPILRERIRNLRTQPLRDKVMTLADQLREEGKIEGQLRAFRTSVVRALEIRHGGCPEGLLEEVERVQDPSTLERLLESALRSHSLEEFVQNL